MMVQDDYHCGKVNSCDEVIQIVKDVMTKNNMSTVVEETNDYDVVQERLNAIMDRVEKWAVGNVSWWYSPEVFEFVDTLIDDATLTDEDIFNEACEYWIKLENAAFII
jgi:hypothetical protein